MTANDVAHRATEQIHAAVDQLAAAIDLARTDPHQGRNDALDAVLDGIRAYFVDPMSVTGAVAAMDGSLAWAVRHGNRGPAAKLMLEAVHRVQNLAAYRLAQEATTRDVKVSLDGIAAMVTNDIGAPDA